MVGPDSGSKPPCRAIRREWRKKDRHREPFSVRNPRENFEGRTMLELLGIGAAGAAGVYGHLKSRKFVRRRLRFTSMVERPGLGIMAGVAAAVLAAPLVAILPILGTGTALLFGAGVGTGVSMGAREARDGDVWEDD